MIGNPEVVKVPWRAEHWSAALRVAGARSERRSGKWPERWLELCAPSSAPEDIEVSKKLRKIRANIRKKLRCAQTTN